MQLREAGLIDLDAPAGKYLRAYRLILLTRDSVSHDSSSSDPHGRDPGRPSLQDLLHFAWGPWDARAPIFSVPFGHPLPSLGSHYRDGLEVVADPGSAFAYSNPGFATLGQIVEDVSGVPLDRYLREHVFQPLNMADTDLLPHPGPRSPSCHRVHLGQQGPRPVPDRDWIGGGGGGVYSTLRGSRRLRRGADARRRQRHGRVLKAETLAADVRAPARDLHRELPAMGLAFFRTDAGGHRIPEP